MSLSELVLEASRVLIALGLAVFVGVPLADFSGRMTRGEEEKKKILFEGEEGKKRDEAASQTSQGLGRARFVAAGGLLVGVLLEVQVMGSALQARHVARAVVLFVLVASLVSSVMVVLPRERYYRERSLTIEENLRPPWVSRADAAWRRAARIDFFGFLLALAALVLG